MGHIMRRTITGHNIHAEIVNDDGVTATVVAFRANDDGTAEYVVATVPSGTEWSEWSNGQYILGQPGEWDRAGSQAWDLALSKSGIAYLMHNGSH